MKQLIKKAFNAIGLGVISRNRLNELESNETLTLQLLERLSKEKLGEQSSYAQMHQDLFVLLETGFKQQGFFVEFGATNGVDLSNTYLLEKQYAWDGILAEPSKNWHEALRQNRGCKIESDCVWSETGKELDFHSSEIGEHSTVVECLNDKSSKTTEAEGEIYKVTTISLTDMLNKHQAPSFVDYLSIDTEGSEYEILKAFDYSRYKIGIIHVEHNYDAEKRQAIYQLLTEKGYQRRYTNFSKWDDWYYLPNTN